MVTVSNHCNTGNLVKDQYIPNKNEVSQFLKSIIFPVIVKISQTSKKILKQLKFSQINMTALSPSNIRHVQKK